MAFYVHTIKVKNKIQGFYLYNFVRKSMPTLPTLDSFSQCQIVTRNQNYNLNFVKYKTKQTRFHKF